MYRSTTKPNISVFFVELPSFSLGRPRPFCSETDLYEYVCQLVWLYAAYSLTDEARPRALQGSGLHPTKEISGHWTTLRHNCRRNEPSAQCVSILTWTTAYKRLIMPLPHTRDTQSVWNQDFGCLDSIALDRLQPPPSFVVSELGCVQFNYGTLNNYFWNDCYAGLNFFNEQKLLKSEIFL